MDEADVLQPSSKGTFRYLAALSLLATFFYTIPIVRTPWGYTSYLRLDDFTGVFFVLLSLGAILGRMQFVETKFYNLLIFAILMAIPSIIFGYLIHRNPYMLKYGIWQFLQYCKIFLIFAAACVVEIDEVRYRKAMLIIWWGSIFIGCYGVLQYFGYLSPEVWIQRFGLLEETEFASYQARALGPLSYNYACIGNYMVVAILMALGLMRSAKSISKVIFFASTLFFAAVVVLSRSRAGLFGIMLSLVFYLLFSKVNLTAIVVTILGFGVIYLIISAIPQLSERFIMGETGVGVEEFSSGRIYAWQQNVTALLSHPYRIVFGVGLGAFGALFYAGEVSLGYAHCNYLQWLTECGILGLVMPFLFLSKIFGVFRQLTKDSGFYHHIGIVFSALLLSLLGVATTQENFVPGTAMAAFPTYIAFLFGFTIALYRHRHLSTFPEEVDDIIELNLNQEYTDA